MHRLITALSLTLLLLSSLIANTCHADDVSALIDKAEEISSMDPVAGLDNINSIEAQVRQNAPHRLPFLLSLKVNALLHLSKFQEADAIIKDILRNYDLNNTDRARFLWHQGELLFLQGDDRGAYKYLNQASEAVVHTDDNKLLALVISSRAFAAVKLNDLKQAKDDADFLAQLTNQLSDPLIIAEIHYSIAHTYEGYQEFEKAEKNYLKTLEYYQQLNHEQQISTAYYYLGRVKNLANQPKEAMTYHQKSLESAQKSGDLIGEAFAYMGMARSLAILEDHSGALSYLKAANIILSDSSNIELKVGVLLLWSVAARKLDNLNDSQNALESAYEITNKYPSEMAQKKLELDYESAQLNFALGNYEIAYQQLFDFTENNADFHKKKRELAIAVARERQQTDLKEREHQLLNQEKTVQQKAIDSEQKQKKILVVIAVLLALGLFGFTLLLQRNHNMKKSLEQLSITDELTQIANRRYVMQRLNTEFERSRRYGHKLSVSIFDIDHFKQLNDSLGHVIGDEVLKKVARVAKDLIREQDLVGRIGGEEFLIVFPHADLDAAYKVCERLRKSVSIATYSGVHDKTPTISLGVAQLSPSDSIETLMQRADKVLYQAKHQGRNQVVKCEETDD